MSYVMFRAVERAKRSVQSNPSALIQDEAYDLPFSVELTRAGFDAATEPPIAEIRATAVDVLRQAGIGPPKIDAVFMTGGTSLVEPVRNVFRDLFGEEKLRGRETFTSVVDGLARAAFQRARSSR